MAMDRVCCFTSALAIIPEKEVWPAIQKFRLQYDSHVREWPPHINVLYPFVPEKADFEEAAFELAEETKKLGPLTIRFSSLANFGKVVYMVPECKEDPKLAKLFDAVVAAFPNLPRQQAEFVPHMTIAQFNDEAASVAFISSCPPFSIETKVTGLTFLARNTMEHPFRSPIHVPFGGGWDAVEWGDGRPYLFRALDGPPEQVLVYTALALTLDIVGGKLSPSQLQELRATLEPVMDGPNPEFAIALACWLRDKKEIGNRLLPIHILVACARHPKASQLVRKAAHKILLIPSDLTEAFALCQGQQDLEPRSTAGHPVKRNVAPDNTCDVCGEKGTCYRCSGGTDYDMCTRCYIAAKEKLSSKNEAKLPSCLKKAGKDLLENLSEFHAAKYDSKTKAKRLRDIVRDCDASLAGNPPPSKKHKKEEDDLAPENAGKGKGKGKGKGGGKGKGKGKAPKGKGKGKGKGKESRPLSPEELKKRRDDALMKLQKLRSSELPKLVRICHPETPHDLMQKVLRKRYPQSEGAFHVAQGVSPAEACEGFDAARADELQRLKMPDTWERLLSKHGNIPPTWRTLLVAEPFELGMTALLRNLRNILQMGFALPFLDKNVFRRIMGGGGQAPVVLAQTLGQMKKDFPDSRLEEMVTEAEDFRQNIMAYHRVQRWLRGTTAVGSESSISPTQDLVEKFLGTSLLESFWLRYHGGCYLKLEQVTPRDGTATVTRSRIVPFCPPDKEVIEHMERAFLKGIERASEHGVPEIPGAQQALVWLDFAPAALGGAVPGLGPGEDHLCGLAAEVPAVLMGKQVRLEQVVRSQRVNLEVHSAGVSCMSRISAFDWKGNKLWGFGGDGVYEHKERIDGKGEKVNIAVESCLSGSGSNSSPYLNSCYVDLSRLEEDVFAVVLEVERERDIVGSVSLREVPQEGHSSLLGMTYDKAFDNLLKGGHNSSGNLGSMRGKPRFGVSFSGNEKKKGLYAAIIHRDIKGDKKKWVFRMEKVEEKQFSMAGFQNAESVLTRKDPDMPAMLRACQLRKAFAAGGGGSRCIVTGLKWGLDKPAPGAVEVQLKGNFLEDVTALQEAKSAFMDRPLPGAEALAAVSALQATGPSVLVRVGNVPEFPPEAVPSSWGGSAKLCALDMQGQLSTRPDLLLASAVKWLPGNVESSIRMLRSALDGTGDLVSFVKTFGPAPAPVAEASEGEKAAPEKPATSNLRKWLELLRAEAEKTRTSAGEESKKAREEWERMGTELEELKKQARGHKRLCEDLDRTMDSIRKLGKAKWEAERQPAGLLTMLKQQASTYDAAFHGMVDEKLPASKDRKQELEKGLVAASRAFRAQEGLLRNLDESIETAHVRRRLRCRYTQASVMDAQLGLGIRVQIKIGRPTPFRELDSESEDEDKDPDEWGVEEWLKGRKGDYNGLDGGPGSEEGIWKIKDATCRADLFSLEAFKNGKASRYPDDNFAFQHFLPLALDADPEAFYKNAKGCLLAVKAAVDREKKSWLQQERTAWEAHYTSADVEAKDRKERGKTTFRKRPPPVWSRSLTPGDTMTWAPRPSEGDDKPSSPEREEQEVAGIAFQLMPALLNGALVEHQKEPTDHSLQLYCVLQHTFLALYKANAALRSLVDSRVQAFVSDESLRSKSQLPDLGRFLQLLLVTAGGSWSEDVGAAIAEELLARQAPRFISEGSFLAENEDEQGRIKKKPPTRFEIAKGKGKGTGGDAEKLEERIRLPRDVMDLGALVPDEDRYLREKWRLAEIGSGLVLFVHRFIEKLGAAAGGSYERLAKNYGRPSWEERRTLMAAPPLDFAAFGAELRGFPKGGAVAAQHFGVEAARRRFRKGETGYYSPVVFAKFEGAARREKRPPYKAHIGFEGDECSGGCVSRLKKVARLSLLYNRRFDKYTHSVKHNEKKTRSYLEETLRAGRWAFHVKVLELGAGSTLGVGWSWRVVPSAGQAGEGVAVLGDPDCGKGLSVCYRASGKVVFGNQELQGPALKVNDVLTCIMRTTPTKRQIWTVDRNEFEECHHEGDPVVFSFAINGRPIDVCFSFKYRELGEMALMLQMRLDWDELVKDRDWSVQRMGGIDLCPTVLGDGFRVRALGDSEGLEDLRVRRTKKDRDPPAFFQGVPACAVVSATEALPRGGVLAVVELLRSGEVQAKSRAATVLKDKAPHLGERKELVDLGVLKSLLAFASMPASETVEEDTGFDHRIRAAEALAAFAAGCRSWGTKQTQQEVADAGALPVLIEMLKTSTADGRQEAARAIESIVANLETTQAAAVEAGVVPRLMDMVRNGEETCEFVRGGATSVLYRVRELPQTRKAILSEDKAISVLGEQLRRTSSSESTVRAAAVLGALADTGPEQQAAVAEEEEVLEKMVNLLNQRDVDYVTDVAEAILRVIKDNGRNQERASQAGILATCANSLSWMSGRRGHEGSGAGAPVVKLLDVFVKDVEKNPKKLAGVASGVNDLVRFVTSTYGSLKKGQTWAQLEGTVQVAQLLVAFASHSKANETTVSSAFKKATSSADKFDWYDWIKKEVAKQKGDDWEHATGVGAVIRGNNGEVWGKVVAEEGDVWKLESGRIAKKATQGQKWYWDTKEGC